MEIFINKTVLFSLFAKQNICYQIDIYHAKKFFSQKKQVEKNAKFRFFENQFIFSCYNVS